MRIGCLQFAPQVGDINNNLSRADAVLNRANPDDLDLLVLPELAFTGYNFRSLQQISPSLECQGSGISALWARTTALRLNCVVTVGYPEKVDVESRWPASPEYYNSVIAVNSDGETISNYRKAFLYYTDETWALEGPEGFYGSFVPELGTTTSMGICMDLNPYKFEAPWHAFEFAYHCLEVKANLVILTMAWLTREDASLFNRRPIEPDMETLTYWISRLEPLIRSENQEEIIIVFCNRTGVEGDAVYAGTSAVIGIKDGEVNMYGMLGRGERNLLVVDTEKPPYAKLVYRPDDQASAAAAPVPDSPSGFGSDQAASSAQPSPKGISAETAGTDTAEYQAQGSSPSRATYAPLTSTNSSNLTPLKDVDDITDHSQWENTPRYKKAQSLPIPISSFPTTDTPPSDTSPQPSTGFAQFPSYTPPGTPTGLHTWALARADSPTLSMDTPVTSREVVQPQSVINYHAEGKLSAQTVKAQPLHHAAHSTGLGEVGVGRSQSGAASRGRRQATFDAPDDRHKLLDSVKRPNASRFDVKGPLEAKTEIGRNSSERSVRGVEYEDEIVEIVVRRSSSCLVHGRSQGNGSKTPECAVFQNADGDYSVPTAEETGPRQTRDAFSTFIGPFFDDMSLNLDDGTSPVK